MAFMPDAAVHSDLIIGFHLFYSWTSISLLTSCKL
jgi:hypothetical protein